MSELLNNLHNPESTAWKEEALPDIPDTPEPEATPEPAPEPVSHETQAEPEAAAEPEQPRREQRDNQEQRVPLQALQAERAKRAEMERRLAEYEKQGRIEQQQPQEPDPETDPIGYLKYAKEQMAALRQANEQQQFETRLKADYNAAAQSFAQEVPDFGKAYQYLLQSRANELQALGTPVEQINTILQREELTLANNARMNGINPAQAIYQFAQARGYRYQDPAPAPKAEAAPAIPAPEQVKADAALQKARQAVSATAASGGKPATKPDMSIEDIAALDGAAFDSAFDKFLGQTKGGLFRH